MMKHIEKGILVMMILASCGPGRKVTRNGDQYKNLPEITVSPNDEKNKYRATAPRLWDITHTRVALSFNWKERTANGEAWIDMHPYFYAQDSIVLDAKGMEIEKVLPMASGSQALDGVATTLTYSYVNGQLIVRLNKSYDPSKSIQLYIKYKAMPYAETSGGSAAISDDRGLYFINTDGAIANKPQQVWTQGETESNSHWLPTIDKPNERFTVQVELTVQDSMETLGNGTKTSSVKNGNGLRTDIWVMDKPIQAYAIMFAIGKFEIVKDKWRDKEVNYYVEEEYAPYARKMFKNTPEMMEYFSDVTGVPYPLQKYSQVVVRDYFSGAMENTSASLFGEFMNQDAREIADKDHEDIVAHELFHQWFGDYVTQESWSNLTLSESFANYGEQLWKRHKYGDEQADELGYEDLQKYLRSKNYAPPLVRFYYRDKEDMFDRISYEKGGAILKYLHHLVGDAAFYSAMRTYLTKHALTSAEATDWRKAVEQVTGQDWSWFFNQFYYRGGHPELDVQYYYDDKLQELTVTIIQSSTLDTNFKYRLPLKAAILYNSEKSIVDWNVVNKKEVFKYPYKNGVKPIIVPDATHVLPGRIEEYKTSDQWLIQYREYDDHISRRMAIDEALKNKNDENAKLLIDKALSDKSALLRAYVLQNMTDFKGDAFVQRWKSVVEYIAKEDNSNAARAAAFVMAGKWKLTEMKGDMITALGDSSYKVAGAALNALYHVDEDTAIKYARRILDGRPKAELESAAEISIARKGEASDMAYFEKKASYVYGSRKLSLTTILAAYLSQVNDLMVFDKGVNMMYELAKNENINGYRSYVVLSLINLANNFKSKGLDNEVKRNKIKKLADELVKVESDTGNVAKYNAAMEDAFGDGRKNGS
jgi:aminopeptidase N